MLSLPEVVEAYNVVKLRFYPNHIHSVFPYPKHWKVLVTLLDREKIAPFDYFFWVFGLLEKKPYPPLPNILANVHLIQKFKTESGLYKCSR